jgi:hypothetical protein
MKIRTAYTLTSACDELRNRYKKEKQKQLELSSNSYKPITNTAWVGARLCKLQKRVHSTRSRK